MLLNPTCVISVTLVKTFLAFRNRFPETGDPGVISALPKTADYAKEEYFLQKAPQLQRVGEMDTLSQDCRSKQANRG